MWKSNYEVRESIIIIQKLSRIEFCESFVDQKMMWKIKYMPSYVIFVIPHLEGLKHFFTLNVP